jgi:hypothetical protein
VGERSTATRTAVRDQHPDWYFSDLEGELRSCTPGHRVAFAALLAARRLLLVDEDADWAPRSGKGASLQQMMTEVWGQACGHRIATQRLAEFEEDLSEIGVNVDPDRYRAFDNYRGIWIIRLAVRCCAAAAGAPGADALAALAVARASVEMAAGCALAADDVADFLVREQWQSQAVQAEVLRQRALLGQVLAIPTIDAEAVRRLLPSAP